MEKDLPFWYIEKKFRLNKYKSPKGGTMSGTLRSNIHVISYLIENYGWVSEKEKGEPESGFSRPAAKPEDLSFILKTCLVKGEKLYS